MERYSPKNQDVIQAFLSKLIKIRKKKKLNPLNVPQTLKKKRKARLYKKILVISQRQSTIQKILIEDIQGDLKIDLEN